MRLRPTETEDRWDRLHVFGGSARLLQKLGALPRVRVIDRTGRPHAFLRSAGGQNPHRATGVKFLHRSVNAIEMGPSCDHLNAYIQTMSHRQKRVTLQYESSSRQQNGGYHGQPATPREPPTFFEDEYPPKYLCWTIGHVVWHGANDQCRSFHQSKVPFKCARKYLTSIA